MKKISLIIIASILLFLQTNHVSAMEEAMEEMPTETFEDYIYDKNSYFRERNILIRDLIRNAFTGNLVFER